MSYIQEAFYHICKNAKTPDKRYVVLVSSQQCYGGPEEGGLWYSVKNVESYQEYPTEDQANRAANDVKAFAQEISAYAQTEHGEHCLRQMEWLDARGLDADFLPENDGPEEYEVWVTEDVPSFDNHKPHYE